MDASNATNGPVKSTSEFDVDYASQTNDLDVAQPTVVGTSFSGVAGPATASTKLPPSRLNSSQNLE